MGMLDFHRSGGTSVGHSHDRLEDCPRCKRDLVQPVSYEPLWGDRWLVALECPNCDWAREGIWPHIALRRLEDHLDAVDDRLWVDLLTLEQARAEREIATFAGALANDAILPEDF